MPDSSIFYSPAPYHILAYGTLLGTQFWQSFLSGPISYHALPRPQFSTLQSRLFPIYFGLQTALPAILALTYPSGSPALPSSLPGVLEPSNHLSVLYPLLTILATSAINLLVVGPATTNIMKERKHQETRDGKKSYDPAPHSREMLALNSRFGKMHGVSSLLNLAGVVATVVYGFTLAGRL